MIFGLRNHWSRRHALASSLAGLASCQRESTLTKSTPSVSFVGQNPALSHRLREPNLKSPRQTIRTPLLIVGAGAAGASAAYWAKRHGLDDFHLIELEAEAGGTARSASAAHGSFPMGAHYLPEPPRHCKTLLAALQDIGFSRLLPGTQTLDYDPLRIAPAPLERHLYRGYWHDGLYPSIGSSAAETAQWEQWKAHLQQLRHVDPGDQRPLLSLPLSRSHPSVAALDRVSAQQYLLDRGYTSWRLHWLVDYACRDDFGLTASQCSALAMLHHFLARSDDEAEHERFLLTGPRGNHDLVDALLDANGARNHLHLQQMALAVRPQAGEVDVLDLSDDSIIRYQADAILWASPYFILRALTQDVPAPAMSYTPWLVAGVSLRERPSGPGQPLSWDNVAIEAEHLGYIVADHGAALDHLGPATTLAFYEPHLADETALSQVRTTMLQTSLSSHVQRIAGHLERMHPGIASSIEAIQIARWGHAMVRPLTGSLLSPELARCREQYGKLRCCHSDIAGLPLFEEAFYTAIVACQAQLEKLGLAGGDIA